MACKRCGQCCIYANVIMEGQRMAEDTQELARWFTDHHITVMPVSRPGGDVLGLRIPLVCQHLEFDTASGTAHCLSYDTRPQLCQDYICQAAKK